MPPKFAGKYGKRGGAPSNPSRNSRFFAICTDKPQFPRNQMPPKSSGNQGRRSVAGRKIKQVWRPKEKPAPWTELPRDITANILHRLGAIAILETVQKVCTTWRSVCKDPAMWRVIDMHSDLRTELYDLEKICRHAVDRSQGQLVDINLEYFATNELLDYISERSGKLKRLRLACCDDVTGEGLIKAVKRFPELEELRIILFIIYVKGGICNETIEMVGRSCPLLRTLEFDKSACCGMDDKDAMAIARSMPKLRHLQLCGNGLSNEGLEAILDGCPLLESLDLRRCGYVELKGALLKRCSSQIKCLKYPDEPSSYSDYEDDFDFDEDDCESFDGGFPPYPYPYRYFDPDFLDYEDYDINEDNYHLFFDDFTRLDHEDYLSDGDYFPCPFFF